MNSNLFKFFVIFFLSLSLLFSAKPVLGEITPPSTTPISTAPVTGPWQPGYGLEDKFNQSLNTNNQWTWAYNYTAGQIEILNDVLGGNTDPKTGKKRVGALGYLALYSDYLLTTRPPINSQDYLASINPFQPAQAAGTDSLSIVLDVWKLMRNIAYISMVLVLVAIGFMIMFRTQIDPRTVVTVSNALPNIVIALILITFSYAISGLILDLSKVLEGFLGSVLAQLNGPLASKIAKTATCDEIKKVMDTLIDNCRPISGLHFPQQFSVSQLVGFFTSFRLEGFDLIQSQGFNPLAFGINEVGKSLLNLVFVFVTFGIAIQLFIKLITFYAGFFILTLVSPLAALFSALPGRSSIFKKWFKAFLAGALSFPLIYFVVNLGFFLRSILIANRVQNIPIDTSSVPNLIAPLITNGAVSTVITLGVLIIASKIPAMVEEALEAALPAHVERAGMDLGSSLKKLPLIGGLVG